MKKFLDPVANAKTLGFLLIIITLPRILLLPFGAREIFQEKPLDYTFLLLFSVNILYLAAGIGLRKTRRWGANLMIISTIYSVILVIYSIVSKYATLNTPTIALNLLYILAATWLFRVRHRLIG